MGKHNSQILNTETEKIGETDGSQPKIGGKLFYR